MKKKVVFANVSKTTLIYQKFTIDKGRISIETFSLNKRSRLFFKDLYFFINIKQSIINFSFLYIYIYIYGCG